VPDNAAVAALRGDELIGFVVGVGCEYGVGDGLGHGRHVTHGVVGVLEVLAGGVVCRGQAVGGIIGVGCNAGGGDGLVGLRQLGQHWDTRPVEHNLGYALLQTR
jgi:hypothetical protein